MKPLLLTLREMARVTGGRWRNLPEGGLDISGINFYLPHVSQGDIFVYRPQKGATDAEAALAVDRAFRSGAVAAVVSKGCDVSSERPLLEVLDADKALQDLAAGASLKFDGTRVLVTGSHGKTGFKNQLYHLIRKQIPTHVHLSSANREFPVMRTLASLPQCVDVAIVEAAVPARNVGQDRSFFVRPDFCVITGIAPEHLKSHKTMENLVLNKAAIVTGLRPGGRCLLNGDDPYFLPLQAAVRNFSACPIVVFGSAASCEGRLIDATFEGFRWRVRAEILGERIDYDLPLLECYSPLASVGVLLQAKLLGADLAACVVEYADYRNYESCGNLYRVPLGTGSFFVYDQSRRAELKGFESMFELMSRLHPAPGGRKIVVMSEFFDIEDNPGLLINYSEMRVLMENAQIDLLYTVKDFMLHQEALPASLDWRCHGTTPDDIWGDVLSAVRENDMLFLRADPPANLGRLVKALLGAGSAPAENIY